MRSKKYSHLKGIRKETGQVKTALPEIKGKS